MFERVRLVDGSVIAWPRRNVKKRQPTAFDVNSGCEVPAAQVELALAEEAVRPPAEECDIGWRSAAVGKGESEISFYLPDGRLVETTTVPDAISRVERARFGWCVGCRDGFLYAFSQIGEMLWKWETPGSSAFRIGGAPSEGYLRPSPYYLASNGEHVLVASWGTVWCVNSEGATLWSKTLATLDSASSDDEPATLPNTRDDAAATDIELLRVRRAKGRIQLRFGFPQHVTAVLADGDDWLVGGSQGDLFRLAANGVLKGRVQISRSSVVPVYDTGGQLAAFASQPNLWFIDHAAPVRLPDAYQWTIQMRAVCGPLTLAHRRFDRHLGLIDEQGQLVVQVCCPRSITSIDVDEGRVAFVAAALVVLDVPGLSVQARKRRWHSRFLGDPTCERHGRSSA